MGTERLAVTPVVVVVPRPVHLLGVALHRIADRTPLAASFRILRKQVRRPAFAGHADGGIEEKIGSVHFEIRRYASPVAK